MTQQADGGVWLPQDKGKAKHPGLFLRTLSLGPVKNVTRMELAQILEESTPFYF